MFAGQPEFVKDAKYWGELEPVTPWMELHRARHYQFYPFVNLGHALLARSDDPVLAAQFTGYMRQGLEQLQLRAVDDPFPLGVPFIWCSNNLVTAAATQARLYREMTGDQTFAELEAALIDWLFGCNPWGTSMICGFPERGDSPMLPHSAYTYLRKETTFGGLVDGPVYQLIYGSLLGIHLFNPDEYADYQSGKAVYHDDIGDYSTNEPTMDGTASLSYLLSSLECEGRKAQPVAIRDKYGVITRFDPECKTVYLIFSAHSDLYDGKQAVADALRAEDIVASFFFTGKFYADPQHGVWIRNLIDAGHYLGAHSDRHLLYADWNDRSKTLVTKQECLDDLAANFEKMQTFGLTREQCRFFLPPFEWYNGETAEWCKEFGLQVVNYTPKTTTFYDFTTPDMPSYKSSETIFEELKAFENRDANGLNGAILLIHVGTESARQDKFYNRLPEIIRLLKDKGYSFGQIADVF
jgi:peptidoglycan/xylan/chitin deacetylase (PgdA/CDA1 family)